jgi:hypothetical protein
MSNDKPQGRHASNRVVFFAIMLPTLAGLVIYAAYNYRLNTGREARMAPFQAHIATYLDKAAVCPTCPLCLACGRSYRDALVPGQNVPTPQLEPGYIRGKAVLVNLGDASISPLTLDLPAELRPETPEEVSSAVWFNCVLVEVGTYSRGGGAYQESCELTIIDLATQVVVGGKTMSGSAPANTNFGSQSRYGSDVMGDIVEYLAGLPRR